MIVVAKTKKSPPKIDGYVWQVQYKGNHNAKRTFIYNH